MKKLIFSAAICLALASCGDDDNNQPTVIATGGTWKLTAVTLDEAHDINGDGTPSKNLSAETGCFNNSGITFANGIGTLTVQDVDIALNTTPANGQFTFECLDPEVYTFSYNETSNAVYLTNTSGDILEMTRTGNTLSTYFEEGTSIPVVIQGNTSYIDVGTTFTFTKQ